MVEDKNKSREDHLLHLHDEVVEEQRSYGKLNTKDMRGGERELVKNVDEDTHGRCHDMR